MTIAGNPTSVIIFYDCVLGNENGEKIRFVRAEVGSLTCAGCVIACVGVLLFYSRVGIKYVDGNFNRQYNSKCTSMSI